jgi:hypothetical protein
MSPCMGKVTAQRRQLSLLVAVNIDLVILPMKFPESLIKREKV